MDRILAKKKGSSKGPFMVFRQSEGFPCVDDLTGESYKEEDLLFPPENSRVADYEMACLQGLLSNPNIVQRIGQLSDVFFINELKMSVEYLVNQMVYGDSRQLFI